MMIIGGLVGTPIGKPTHEISGKFYIVDSKTLFIEDFNYDGLAPGEYMLYILLCSTTKYSDQSTS